MADYNYHRPDIVGFEWAPIKNAAYQPDPVIERGYEFSVPVTGGAIVPRRGLYFVDQVPVGHTITQIPIVSVYRKDQLFYGKIVSTQTYDIQAAVSTGDGNFNGGTGVQCLSNPSDNRFYEFGTSPPDSGTLTMQFSMSAVVGTITNVSLVYAASGDLTRLGSSPNNLFTGISKVGGSTALYGTGILEGGTNFFGDDTIRYGRISFGDVDPHGPYTATNVITTNERIPWNSGNVQLFRSASSPQYEVSFSWTNTTAGLCKLHYAALEVTSVGPAGAPILSGGLGVGSNNVGLANAYAEDANYVNLFAFSYPAVTGVALPPTDYVVTMKLGDVGDMRSSALAPLALAAPNTRPFVNAIRELYGEPPIRGVEITRPQTANERFVVESSHIIPTVAITTTGSPTLAYAECHGYEDSSTAVNFSVFSNIAQNFQSVNYYGALEYRWFRFYARRVDGTPCTGMRLFVTGVGVVGEITGEEFDALPEIVDGWREVDLRLNVPVTLDSSGTLRNFRIDYEPSTVGSFFNEVGLQVLAAGSDGVVLQPATYQPNVSNVTAADITFLFSTDPPTVTGLAVIPNSFPITGIGLECATPPGCIPTGVPYNHVTWSIPNFQTSIFDSFDRTLASSWGNANTGQLWTNTGGAASDYSVTGSAGLHTITSTNVARHSTIGPSTLRDFDVTTVVRMPSSVAVTGAPWSNSVLGRFTDVNNNYRFQAEITTDEDTFNISIIRRSGGSDTVLRTGIIDTGYPLTSTTEVQELAIRVSAQGPVLRMKIWDANDQPEPNTWQLIAVDSTFTAGQVGVRTIVNTGSLAPLPLVFRYTMFWCSPLLDNFGYYEVQRSDDYTDWETILTATSPGVTGFVDTEARVGVRSDYRIRQVNVHHFTGPWSVTVTGVAPNPASTLSGDSSGHELLLFSTNTDQSGRQVLAYEQVWESNPSNEMTYFEGNGMVQFQQMYDRNYQVAFHGTERGGAQFTRMVLVQNAAVSPPVLERAFMSLRDLAWASVPYVCVRTSNADRWYSAVEVPTGTISRKRRLQLVQVRVTEVSDTPYAIDPPLPYADTLRSELPCRAQVLDS